MNAEQTEAATSQDAKIIVLAGPGAGKTTVIVERAKHLAAQGVATGAMAFVTFTNIGAKVLRRRLNEAVGPVGFVGTLHAMMLRFLRKENPKWTMISEQDAEEFIQRFAKQLGYKGPCDALKKARVWSAGTSTTPEARVIKAYHQFLREGNMLDHDLVLIEGRKLLESDDSINPWICWFADEVQDSAPIDLAIYKAAAPELLTIVADPDQAIYTFRGADPSGLARLERERGGFTRYLLSLNYRCASHICDVANAIISLNSDRIEKSTVSATEMEGDVICRQVTTESVEGERVAATAKQWIEEGVAPHEIAVLCRTNKLASSMRRALASGGVQVAEVTGVDKPKDWRLLTSLISLIASPNNVAIGRLCVRQIARLHGNSPDVCEESFVRQHASTDSSATDILSLPTLDVVLKMNAMFSRYGVSRASHDLLADRIRLYAPANAEELMEALNSSPEAKGTRGVNVMTVHAAKGEEWDAVIVPGLDTYTCKEVEQMGADVRLAFVAVTRARKRLALFGAAERSFTFANGQTITLQNTAGDIYTEAWRSVEINTV